MCLYFYKSENSEIKYSDLIEQINKREYVYVQFKADSFFDFIVNTLVAILHNIDIVLVDYQNNQKANFERQEIISYTKKITNLDELISGIYNSKTAIAIYSSGTENTPKKIFQPVSRLLKSVSKNPKYFNSKWAFTYNHAHSAGIQMILQVICTQGTLIDLYSKGRDYILGAFQKHQIHFISATPTFYRMLVPYNFVFPNVLGITLNGEKSTKELIEHVRSGFPSAEIKNIYGSTESGPLLVSSNQFFTIPDKLKEQISVVNNELCLHSDLVSRSVSFDNWYHTGDLVRIIKKNPLTIEFISRKSRIINVAGYNVNPQEVEENLLRHPSIKDVRVYGKPHPIIGNLLIAEVLPLNDITETELIAWTKEHIIKYKQPKIFHFVKEISSGRTGKKNI